MREPPFSPSDGVTYSSGGSYSGLAATGAHGWVDCVRASDMCNQNPQCSSRYRVMRQCLVGRERDTMLANRECQAALEVLLVSPLYDCRCKRGMKKELQCLQSYWSIHMGLTEGETEINEFLFVSGATYSAREILTN
ncbi:unnamed protein product [Oncorhynchus mykiss]|uniref:GDNF/GAS1 domain-containing protein n=1 Tax=Oncorhynchus mykiss TaxID=8022 RepID=A0A060XZD5_ONCMY|nr:unnamed protein product [Oncorhynchus mykiss]